MIEQLLMELQRRDIRIWADGDRLKYDAPRGALTEDLVALLRLHKDAILKRFAAVNNSASAHIPKADRRKAMPLSFAQERMWFLWNLTPDSPAYNVTSAIKLTGRLNTKAVVESLRAIQQRHEVLRTHFVETPDGVIQMTEETAYLEIPVIELTDGTSDEREDAARLRMLEEGARPFDLRRKAPFEARVYRLDETVHWLFIKLHHIVADAWSFSIILREFASFYESIDRGNICTLKGLPIQYADFAVWQREQWQGALREEMLSYWRQQLSGDLTPLSLSTDRPRPPVKSTRGDRVSFQLPPGLSARLAEVGRSHQATKFMILMSAFRILLYRYTGQMDFLIGTPTIWRNHPETEPLIGYFGNTLVLRNPLKTTDSYLEVLARECQTALDSYEHQEIPFETLVEELVPERALSHSPLFEVMFSFGEGERDVYRLPDLSVEVSEITTSTAKFDILLSMQETQEDLIGVIEYASELFERETIERMAAHLEVLLTGIAYHPEGNICETPLLTAREQQVLLGEWNNTTRPLLLKGCLHELFEAQAEAHSLDVAVYYGEEKITYAQLNEEANRLAHRLVKLGTQREQLVGVCLRRSPRLIAALLSILKAGAAYVPIDPYYPPDRIKLMLDDSRVEVLITERALVESLPETDSTLLLLDDEDAAASEERHNLVSHVKTDNLAYVLYTSGSTGRPKGVMIEHRSALALLDWAYSIYSSEELTGVLAATSVCFDLSIFELFVPLCAGHSVILAENALEMPLLPARDAVTLINTVPSVMDALLQAHRGAFPTSLQVVNLAGERLETRVLDEVYRQTRARKVYDLYGPTEATTYSLFKLRLPQQPPSIGRPIFNTRIYVLDENEMPVPVGVVGELYLAGEGLARGYLKRPDLTAERFITPRSKMIPDKRLYRTGDLVRYTRTGEIEYQGRNDDQIKVRGFRIEPGEVKAALLTVEGVEDALVTGRSGQNVELYLAAYVVCDPQRFSVKHAKLHLRKLLPEYMIPSVFAPVRAIPLSPNGKVDFSQLEEPKESDIKVGPDLPRTETEMQISNVWKEVLKVESLSVHDSFFDLGGHSLTAMRVVARLNDVMDIDLPLRAFFQYPTIYELASEVETLPRGARASALPPLRAHANINFPPTLLQKHLWFIDRLVINSSYLNIRNCISLKGIFDLSAAKRALDTIIERHPILRAKFITKGEHLQQEVAFDMPLDVVVEDLSGIADEEAQHHALASIYSKAVCPFNIRRGPCSRFMIVRLSEDHHIVIMVLHHIIVDEWSVGILFKEFAVCYATFINGLPSPLLPPPFTFADYAIWEQECIENHMFDPQFAFWKERLKQPLPRLKFYWQDEQSGAQAQIESYEVKINTPLCDKLAAVARRGRSSLFVVLLSALKRLLQRQTGLSDIRVCTNLAYRHQRGLEDIIGPLIDTLILRTELPADHTPLLALRLVRDTFIEACAHQDIPFEEMASRLTSEADIQREDLAQAFFLFQEEGPLMPPLPGLIAGNADLYEEGNFFKSALHNYDLILFLYKDAEGIRGQFTLRGQLEDGSVGTEVLSMYGMLLEELVSEQS